MDLQHELANLAHVLQSEADLMFRGKVAFAETRETVVEVAKRLKVAVVTVAKLREEET